MCGFLTCFLLVLKKRKIFNILQNARPIKKTAIRYNFKLLILNKKNLPTDLARQNKNIFSRKNCEISVCGDACKIAKKTPKLPAWERFGAVSKAITSQSLQVPVAPIRTTFPRRQIQNRLCSCACRGIGAYCSLCTFCLQAGLRRL